MHLLQVALSPRGYQKILDIMGSDEALSKSGTPYCSGTACYTIGIFGQPSTTKPWMLEFGGHVSVNRALSNLYRQAADLGGYPGRLGARTRLGEQGTGMTKPRIASPISETEPRPLRP